MKIIYFITFNVVRHPICLRTEVFHFIIVNKWKFNSYLFIRFTKCNLLEFYSVKNYSWLINGLKWVVEHVICFETNVYFFFFFNYLFRIFDYVHINGQHNCSRITIKLFTNNIGYLIFCLLKFNDKIFLA